MKTDATNIVSVDTFGGIVIAKIEGTAPAVSSTLEINGEKLKVVTVSPCGEGRWQVRLK